MLKNDNNLLPLNTEKYKKIALIGPNADRVLLGGYSGTPPHFISVKKGLEEKLAGKALLSYAIGCQLTIGGGWSKDSIVLAPATENETLIKEAVLLAQKSDVVILALGGNEQTSREGWSLNHLGDRSNLDLVGQQNELVRRIKETGKPVVVLLFNGSPLTTNYISESIPTVLESWYLGQECGYAVADVLFGDYNPCGKLPITIPRSVGQIPVYYNHKPFARRGYVFDEVSPLYAFGYGLSYTKFSISNIRLAKKAIKATESTHVLVDVTNTGTRKGTEVVQLYIRDLVSSVTRPVKELKGFRRVTLAAGEKATVEMEITPESLSFYNINMKYGVEPGLFQIMVGNSSDDPNTQKTELVVEL